MAAMAETHDQLISSEHAAVDQVSTTATEMSAAVHEVALNAQNASDAARAQQQSARSRRWSAVPSSRSASWLGEVEGASQTIGALAEETASIGAVLEVIRGIAEQESAALNAAIRPRAPVSSGRGFAVVADECGRWPRAQVRPRISRLRIERLQAASTRPCRPCTGSDKARTASAGIHVDQAGGNLRVGAAHQRYGRPDRHRVRGAEQRYRGNRAQHHRYP
ncbi:methyl-accepting chemotaxis protein [Stutzerimonas xanthomarina]|uniref:methyl-accepting chemotaxis protein n=1 Tax=Stutzerimonas xanthomarina TaxID=271420 RepID=UPI003AA9088A